MKPKDDCLIRGTDEGVTLMELGVKGMVPGEETLKGIKDAG